MSTKFYCMKCKKSVNEEPYCHVVEKNNKYSLKSICHNCGTKLTKFCKKEDAEKYKSDCKSSSRKSAARKSSSRKSAARKSASRKSTARKSASRKSASRKSAARKSAARKSASRKSAARKSAARKSAARKSAARKSAARKSASRKTAARKSAARKSASRKTAARKSAARKSAARKSVARKSTARKSASRKSAARKSAARKSAARKSVARKSVARKSATEYIKMKSKIKNTSHTWGELRDALKPEGPFKDIYTRWDAIRDKNKVLEIMWDSISNNRAAVDELTTMNKLVRGDTANIAYHIRTFTHWISMSITDRGVDHNTFLYKNRTVLKNVIDSLTLTIYKVLADSLYTTITNKKSALGAPSTVLKNPQTGENLLLLFYFNLVQYFLIVNFNAEQTQNFYEQYLRVWVEGYDLTLEEFPNRVVTYGDTSPMGQTPSCYLGAIYQLFVVLYSFLEDQDKTKKLQTFEKTQYIGNLLQEYHKIHDKKIEDVELKTDSKVVKYVDKFKKYAKARIKDNLIRGNKQDKEEWYDVINAIGDTILMSYDFRSRKKCNVK